MSLSLLRQFSRIAVFCLLGFIPCEIRAANVSVQVGNNFFNQKDITVNVGDTVTWVWIGSGHDTVATDGTWSSGLKNVGASFAFTFTAAHAGRRFDYFCTPHRSVGMVGSVTVRAAANQAPTVSLTAPGDGATFSTSDTITFSANAADDAGVSRVEFFSDGNPIGTDTSSPYSVTASLPAGQHSITAKAFDGPGLSTTSSARTITVNAPQNQPPTVTLTAPGNGQTFSTTDMINFSANASDDAGVNRVEFYSDGNLIGTATSNPYSVASTLPAGQHSITAKAFDGPGLSTTSGAITITVNAPQNQAPTVNLTAPGNGSTFSTTDTITFSADATDDAGVNRVEFFSDGNPIGADTSAPYSVTASLPAGQHSITARAFDGPGLSTTSGAITITVNAPQNQPPTVNLTAPANNATFSATDTITFSADATDDAGVNRVEFYSDGNPIGTDTSAPYSVTATLPAGTHSITAKAFDGPDLSTTSAAVQIQVSATAAGPHIDSITINGVVVTITATATSGVLYQLQATVDFGNWSVVNSATAANGSVTLNDVVNTAYKFYRVVAP